MTAQLPCTDCGKPTLVKQAKRKRCASCTKAYMLDYSRWYYRARREDMLAWHREHYAKNRERIMAERKARKEALNGVVA